MCWAELCKVPDVCGHSYKFAKIHKEHVPPTNKISSHFHPVTEQPFRIISVYCVSGVVLLSSKFGKILQFPKRPHCDEYGYENWITYPPLACVFLFILGHVQHVLHRI